MNWWGLLFVFGGLFSIVGAVMDWEWFMNHHKARFISSIFGRSGARIFYVILGLAIIVVGALVTTGIIQDSK